MVYFNPLPRKDGDATDDGNMHKNIYFNPLPRKEGDAVAIPRPPMTAAISIHSLVKRETASFAKIWLNRILILCTFLLEHKKF